MGRDNPMKHGFLTRFAVSGRFSAQGRGLGRKYAPRRVVNPGITRGQDAAIAPRPQGPALPIRDNAAGAVDHWNEGREVVELHPSLDDEIDKSRGQHGVGIAIMP